jgi:hypothetical protein
VDEAKEFVELAGLDDVQGMAGLAFDFHGSFDEQSFEEQFLALVATIFAKTGRHKASRFAEMGLNGHGSEV